MRLKISVDSLDKYFADVCDEEDLKTLRGMFAAYASGASFSGQFKEDTEWDKLHMSFIFAVQSLHDYLERE